MILSRVQYSTPPPLPPQESNYNASQLLFGNSLLLTFIKSPYSDDRNANAIATFNVYSMKAEENETQYVSIWTNALLSLSVNILRSNKLQGFKLVSLTAVFSVRHPVSMAARETREGRLVQIKGPIIFFQNSPSSIHHPTPLPPNTHIPLLKIKPCNLLSQPRRGKIMK